MRRLRTDYVHCCKDDQHHVMYVCIYVCMYVCVCVYLCVYLCIYVCMYVHTNVMQVYTQVIAGKRINEGEQINIVYGGGVLNNDRIIQVHKAVHEKPTGCVTVCLYTPMCMTAFTATSATCICLQMNHVRTQTYACLLTRMPSGLRLRAKRQRERHQAACAAGVQGASAWPALQGHAVGHGRSQEGQDSRIGCRKLSSGTC
jgi:hypothetical protein